MKGSPLQYYDDNGLCRVSGQWVKYPSFGVKSPTYTGTTLGLGLTRLGTLAVANANVRIDAAADWKVGCTIYDDDQCPILAYREHGFNVPFSKTFGLPLGINLPTALLGRGNGYALMAALAAENAAVFAIEYGQIASLGYAAIKKALKDGPQTICQVLHGCGSYP